MASFQLIAREPKPEEAVMMIETVQRLTAGLDERDRRVLERLLQGENVSAIGAELQCTERTVERAVERIRRRLEKMVTWAG